jgi:FemAB-related protein (PEP-CTERM system-associated)
MQVDVSHVAPSDWDTYVESHPDATAYHRAAAVAIGREAFGLRTYYLTARLDDGAVSGVLPLVEQSSLMFGRYLISVPFLTYGGILCAGAGAARSLAERAAALGAERSAAHVELRHSAAVDGITLPVRLDKVSMVLELPDSEAALSKQLGAKLRSQIRRADRESPEVVLGGRELLPEFYGVFARGMHELGTPVYPPAFFSVVCDALGERLSVVVVKVRGEVQAAAIVVRHGRNVEVPWAAATGEAKRNAVNMRMYWELLKGAVAAGAAAFDFGRSTVDSGTYRFKAQWGATPRQLHWHYWLARGGELPKLNHSNPKYALAGRLWRQMPLWCANLLGPQIARHLP